MSDPKYLDALQQAEEALGSVDREKLFRKTLGEESLEKDLQPRIERLGRLQQLTRRYTPLVHAQPASGMLDVLRQIGEQFSSQASLSNSEYISQRQQFLASIDTLFEQAKQWEPHFVTAAVQERGFLEDEGIRQEYQRTIDRLKTEASSTLKAVKDEANKTLAEARALAEEMEAQTRRTAAKVSVEEAQRQFREARAVHAQDMETWGWLSFVALLAFFTVVVGFLFMKLPPESDRVLLGYHLALRSVIIAAVGLLAVFTLRTLRAHIHLYHLSSHRYRVVNAIESFVVSTQTPEQRDDTVQSCRSDRGLRQFRVAAP